MGKKLKSCIDKKKKFDIDDLNLSKCDDENCNETDRCTDIKTLQSFVGIRTLL